MALAFMLNPSRGRRKSRKAGRRKPAHRRRRRCSTKPGAHLSRRCVGARRAAATRRARRAAKAVSGTIHVTEGSGRPSFVLNNPRKKRRGKKGARRMATKKRKRRSPRRSGTKARRRRAGKKSWRTRLRRYAKKRSSVKRRGYKNNPRRRKNSRKRRRNALAIRGMYGNPRKRNSRKRRRNSRGRRRNGAGMYAGTYRNPRRRKNSHKRRRRNPLGFSLGGTFGSIQRALTSPDALMQLAAAAAGGTVSSFLGAWLSAKIADFSPSTFSVMDPTTKQWSWARRILDAATTIASAILIGGFLPGKFKSAFVLGGGAFALKPLVDQALAPLLSSVGAKIGVAGIGSPGGGVGAWISVNQMGRIGMAGMGGRGGMGAWISAQQMANGFRGLGDNQAFDYGQPSQSLMAYDRQPYAGSEAAFTM